MVLFGNSVAERVEETDVSERTLYRNTSCFEEEGKESLSACAPARRSVLPLAIRQMILDLKAERPALDAIEITNIRYAHSDRRSNRTRLPPLGRSRCEVTRYRG